MSTSMWPDENPSLRATHRGAPATIQWQAMFHLELVTSIVNNQVILQAS